MSDFNTLIDNMNPEVYQNMKRSLELGRWPNGELLSESQKAHSMQAIIAYEAKNLPPEGRVGYMHITKDCKKTS